MKLTRKFIGGCFLGAGLAVIHATTYPQFAEAWWPVPLGIALFIYGLELYTTPFVEPPKKN